MENNSFIRRTEAEHILVCLSASPTNLKIIKTAAKMAKAFGASFTALYVKTSSSDNMSEIDKKRLEEHIRLAERVGADITTVYGDDVSYLIAEFARISGVTKIVIGRSNVQRRHFWSKPTLTEKLVHIAPNIDIHIIPDVSVGGNYKERKSLFSKLTFPSVKDVFITMLMLIVVSGIGFLFYELGFTEANIITVYLLGVLLTSLFTKSHACSIISSLISVLLFNFLFTEPRFTFHAYESGYPVTFGIMLIASVITGTLANKLKDHAKRSSQAAFRTKVLFDTNQLLQRAHSDEEIINTTASQLMKLLDRDITVYPEENGKLLKGYLFSANNEELSGVLFSDKEMQAASWVYIHKRRAGATTKKYSDAKCLYHAIYLNDKVYGVIGIHINGKSLDSFENSVLLSILGECALAIENIRNAKEKELAAVLAKNEQLRANLLRAISHDLRTPLTSISGNANNLIYNYEKLDDNTRKQMFNDIFDDSQWLISLVENLLSVTRIEEGRMNFNMSAQLVDEVIEEALHHISRKRTEHKITCSFEDELLLVRMDAKLIMQVIINLVDNAIKYTPVNSEIKVTAEKEETLVRISVCDNGNGISDEMKPRVFDMFYTGDNKIADSRRSLGLGLSLCKSIINAHGGEIVLKDNFPHGCVFSFTLPFEKVIEDE